MMRYLPVIALVFFMHLEGFSQMTSIQNMEEVEKQVYDKILEVRQKHNIHAPDFPKGFDWINTGRSLSLAELKGKIVLLDFWTYCCINCMHIIPELKYLEEKYADEPFVVIGVHSAKFDNEKDDSNIRQAVLRYNVEHPIVVDQNFEIWQSYGARGWPTLVLLDPEGYVIAHTSGEGQRDILDVYIRQALKIYGKKNVLNRAPLTFQKETQDVIDSPLLYPGKIITDPSEEKLYITDSNHNRIIVSDLTGQILDRIGDGETGLTDGDFERARFNQPQGLAFFDNKLLVADTENHAIRLVDLDGRTVKTIAGTGFQNRTRIDKGPGLKTALNSPWDILVVGEYAYIAMAGSHQIWRLNLNNNMVERYAGNGREGRGDGERLKEAYFAQPSGISYDGRYLYVADSEISSIRRLDLKNDGRVRTVAGGDLFDFGDVDGKGDQVRFQHPLGVFHHEDKIYIADTYNHKLKYYHLKTGRVESWAGNGVQGNADGISAQFYEPSGMTVAKGKMYITDTNNHAIRVVDLRTNETTTLSLKTQKQKREITSLAMNSAPEIVLPLQKIRPSVKGSLNFSIELPEAHHFNEGTPLQYLIKSTDGILRFEGANRIITDDDPKRKFSIEFTSENKGETKIQTELLYYYCSDFDGICKIKSVKYTIPVLISGDGVSTIALREVAE
ncbi:MAG: thioredoxin-like domain-containing protein [Calditrichaceae bacterium]